MAIAKCSARVAVRQFGFQKSFVSMRTLSTSMHRRRLPCDHQRSLGNLLRGRRTALPQLFGNQENTTPVRIAGLIAVLYVLDTDMVIFMLRGPQVRHVSVHAAIGHSLWWIVAEKPRREGMWLAFPPSRCRSWNSVPTTAATLTLRS